MLEINKHILQKNWIGPIVKHVWNVAIHVLYNLFGFVVNTTAYNLGWYEPSSPIILGFHGKAEKIPRTAYLYARLTRDTLFGSKPKTENFLFEK